MLLKRNIISLVLCLLAAFFSEEAGAQTSTNSSKSANTITKTVKIGEFDEIEVSSGIQVKFSQKSNPGTAKIEIDPKYQDRIRVKTVGRKLRVYYKPDKSGNINVHSKQPTKVTVSSNYIDEIKAMSSGKVVVEGSLNISGSMEIEVSSSGRVVIDKIKCSKLEVEASSTGKVKIQNLSGILDAEVSSSGGVSVYRMEGKYLEADASSSGNIYVEQAICKKISAEATSSASVSILGIKCDHLEAESNSSGKVELAGVCRYYTEDYSSSGKVIHNKLKVTR